MFKLLVFAGTTEGRALLSALSKAGHEAGLEVVASVATDYGKDLLEGKVHHIRVMRGRLNEDEMVGFIKGEGFHCVIDTTHPYAKVVTENIKAACSKTGCPYIRVVRASGGEVPGGASAGGNGLFFDSHEEVVAFLSRHSGKALMTIGSKELAAYTKLEGYQERLFARVLPMTEVLESCFKLGFQGKQLMAMQGPFSYELNRAMMAQIGAKYLVTKDTGESGGFGEKLQAAEDLGATLLVLGRKEEEGFSVTETLAYLTEEYKVLFEQQEEKDLEGQKNKPEEADLGRWFPLFTNISGKRIVVVGGGKIAKRRILTFCQFHCKVKVVAGAVLPEIEDLAAAGRIELDRKAYEPADLEGADIVLAATNNPAINEEIHDSCKEKGIMVNVANRKEKSDFYFPGLIRKKGLTIGVTAEGKNHSLAKQATIAISNFDFLEGE